MRAAIAFAVLFASTAAYADRDTVFELGIGVDARGRAGSFEATGDSNAHYRAAGRISLAFEPAPSPRIEFHLVPELFAWTAATDRDAEGALGAGVRAEVFGPTRNPRLVGAGVYVAVRGEVMGTNRDPAFEFALGHFWERPNGYRIGYDTAVILRERDDASPERSRELDVVFSFVVGRR
jgi:hypothetical protein